MGTDTQSSTATGIETAETNPWIAGGIGGLVGAVVFGGMIQATMPPIITHAIPALWGLSGLAAGWAVHLVDGVVFGLAFAVVVENTLLRRYAGELRSGWLVGAAWGVVLWALAAGVVMPIWLSAVGFPAAPALPNRNPATLPGHVVYGLLLGLVYAFVRSR